MLIGIIQIRLQSVHSLEPMSKDKYRPISKHTSKDRITPIDHEKTKKAKQKSHHLQPQFRCVQVPGEKLNSKHLKQQSKNPSHENSKQKPMLIQKRVAGNKELFMKDDLKRFLNKNTTTKHKETTVVPQILKKIEQNCKALRQIHQKQQSKMPQQSSLMRSKESREHTPDPTKKGGKQKLHKHKEEKLLKINSVRRSHQLKAKYSKQKHHQKGKKKIAKVQTQAKDQNAIMEIYKEYKRQFQAEDHQIQGKNTNYNTSQTRNSSSLMNSHQQGKINRPKQKKTLQQIQAIVQNQKRDLQQRRPPTKPQVHTSHLRVTSPIPILSNLPSSDSKSFQQSKYYVQPIPPFRQIPVPEQSLAGCEITFIQNDLLSDGSIPSLHL